MVGPSRQTAFCLTFAVATSLKQSGTRTDQEVQGSPSKHTVPLAVEPAAPGSTRQFSVPRSGMWQREKIPSATWTSGRFEGDRRVGDLHRSEIHIAHRRHLDFSRRRAVGHGDRPSVTGLAREAGSHGDGRAHRAEKRQALFRHQEPDHSKIRRERRSWISVPHRWKPTPR